MNNEKNQQLEYEEQTWEKIKRTAFLEFRQPVCKLNRASTGLRGSGKTCAGRYVVSPESEPNRTFLEMSPSAISL